MKSYVTLEQNLCPVCTAQHDTGTILLDKRLKQTFDKHTVTGFSLCKECEKLHSDGYLALVAIDETKSKRPYKPDTVYRTGEIAHIRYGAAKQVFDTPDLEKYQFVFVEPAVIAMLVSQRS